MWTHTHTATQACAHTFKCHFIFFYKSKDIMRESSTLTPNSSCVWRESPGWTCFTSRQICQGNNCPNATRAYIVLCTFRHTRKRTQPWLPAVYISECVSGPLVSEMNYHAASLAIPVSLWNQLESTIRHSFCCHTENNHSHFLWAQRTADKSGLLYSLVMEWS